MKKRALILAFAWFPSLGGAAADMRAPWSKLDQLFKLDLQEAWFLSPANMSRWGCDAQQIERAKNLQKDPRTSMGELTTLQNLLKSEDMRESVLSAKGPHEWYLLGRILARGLLQEEARDRKLTAKDLFDQAAKQDDVDAKAWILGEKMRTTEAKFLDWGGTWEILLDLAKRGSGQAYYLLADHYAASGVYAKFSEPFVPAALMKAKSREWMCHAAELGYPRAFWYCGSDYFFGKSSPANKQLANKWLAQSAALQRMRTDDPGSFAPDAALAKRWRCHVPTLSEACPVCETLTQLGRPQVKTIPSQFRGNYIFKQGDDSHYLVLGDTSQKSQYLGSDNFGEHGMAYFNVGVEDIKLSKEGHIAFRIGERQYWSKAFHPGERATSHGNSVGNARNDLFYQGEIKGERIFFKCKGDCVAAQMTFVRQ